MKRLYFLGAAILMAAVSMAQTPTVSTAGIYMRYCTTTNTDQYLTIPSLMLPYQYGDNLIVESGDYPTIFADKRGCDSIVTLHVTVFDALFSVDNNKQVVFSRGNLQYQATSNTWRFAPKQFISSKADNANVSANYDGWIDLFGYSTSGAGAKPYEISTDCSSYFGGDIKQTNFDWAWYNPISNGGNAPKIWYTMTHEEWNYLFYYRTNASNLKGGAQIDGINGIVLLPDNWDGSISFNNSLSFTSNTYTEKTWYQMEIKGAVFLPETASRGGQVIENIGNGRYWCGNATSGNYSCSSYGYRIRIGDGSIEIDGYEAPTGYAVRPVRDVQ